MITAATIGLKPTPETSFKFVFSPIAPRAIARKNFDIDDIGETIVSGIIPTVLRATTPKNPKINQGKMLAIFTFSLDPVEASFFAYFHEKMRTIGTINSVRVNLTIVASTPAASEKAYPAATTDDVSLTDVPTHRP